MIVSFMIRVKLYKIQTLIGYSYLGILEYLCLTRHDKVVLLLVTLGTDLFSFLNKAIFSNQHNPLGHISNIIYDP
jgi:hypothetical protein